MAMTREQKFAKVLEGLAEALASKDTELFYKDYRIKELEEKLAAAEAERDAAKQQLEESETYRNAEGIVLDIEDSDEEGQE